MTNAQNITTGATCQQYNGKTKIRLVKVLAISGTTVEVEALFGLLAGSRYEIPASDLNPPS